MNLAPIVLFAYKRPLHTKAVLDSLCSNPQAKNTKLYIFVDGIKTEASEKDIQLHREVVDVVKKFNGCSTTEVFISSQNKGLAASVVKGVSNILDKHKRVIVLEDDLLVSPYFLEYMNTALDKYEVSEEVACVSGYVYPLKREFNSAYFVKGADCWGWATWENKWKTIFRNEPEELLKQLIDKNLQEEFNFNNSYSYTSMLQDRIFGKNQSWAILWYASAFLKNKLCLYPTQSLVQNIGNDGTGTHSEVFTNKFDSKYMETNMPLLPDDIVENKIARKEFEAFFRDLSGSSKQSLTTSFKRKIKSILGL